MRQEYIIERVHDVGDGEPPVVDRVAQNDDIGLVVGASERELVEVVVRQPEVPDLLDEAAVALGDEQDEGLHVELVS